jgi:hypothetical protein
MYQSRNFTKCLLITFAAASTIKSPPSLQSFSHHTSPVFYQKFLSKQSMTSASTPSQNAKHRSQMSRDPALQIGNIQHSCVSSLDSKSNITPFSCARRDKLLHKNSIFFPENMTKALVCFQRPKVPSTWTMCWPSCLLPIEYKYLAFSRLSSISTHHPLE